MRDGYIRYVELNNKAAHLNGNFILKYLKCKIFKNKFLDFADGGKMWLQAYEDENFVAKVDAAWAEVEPLYNELHIYVRRRLKNIYGDQMDDSDDLIPAHVLGNMWYGYRSSINYVFLYVIYGGGQSLLYL